MFSSDNAGRGEGLALWCSISWARRRAQLSPAGPAPTMTTSASSISLSVSAIGSGPRTALEHRSPAGRRLRAPIRIYHDRLQMEVAGSMRTYLRNAAAHELTGLLRQAGELLFEGVGNHGVRAVFLLDLLVNLAGALRLSGPVNVRHSQQRRGAGNHGCRMVRQVLINFGSLFRLAGFRQHPGQGKLGLGSDFLVGVLAGVLQGFDGGGVIAQLGLADSHLDQCISSCFGAGIFSDDLRKLREGLLIFRIGSGITLPGARQSTLLAVADIRMEGANSGLQFGVRSSLPPRVITFDEPYRADHHQHSHGGDDDLLQVLLGKDLERLHFFREIILLQLVTRKSIHGSPSVSLTIVILATEFAKGQLHPAANEASKKLQTGISGRRGISSGSPISAPGASGDGRLGWLAAEFNFEDFKQKIQDSEKKRPQNQAQKAEDGEPADDTDEHPERVNLHSPLDQKWLQNVVHRSHCDAEHHQHQQPF